MKSVDPDNEATFSAATIPSTLTDARREADVILEDVEREGYDSDSVFAIKLALEEALTNAIKHGNKNDSNKSITIKHAVSDEKCVIIVRDQGEGFDPCCVPDCTSDERLPLPSGRGIMLMRSYMDRVCYRDGGREVCMTKNKR